jgi:replicative DNA helicase
MTLNSIDAEQALLGALLFDNAILERVGFLCAEHFYEPVHGVLWAEIHTRIRGGRAVDGVSLREWWNRNAPDGITNSYLMDITGRGSSVLSVQAIEYAGMIRNAALNRQLIAAAHTAIGEAQAGLEASDAINGLEAALREIDIGDDADAWTSMEEGVTAAVDRAERGKIKGISTGLEELDEKTGGLRPGTMWVAGAATSMGKSVFIGGVARNVAAQGYGVAAIHLEMDQDEVFLREASAQAFNLTNQGGGPNSNPHYLSAIRQKLSGNQWARLRQIRKDMPLYVDARPNRSLTQIESAARRLFRKLERKGVKPGLLVLDHEGLIAPERGVRHPSMLEAASARGQGLMDMAKRLKVCVLVAAQITNDGARADGDDRLPVLGDIKYGGALTQAANVTLLLHRKAYVAKRKPEHMRTPEDWDALRSRETTIVIDKARGGETGQIKICMDMPTAAVFSGRAA